MKTHASWILTALYVGFFYPNQAIACGGQDLTDAQITASAELKAVKAQIQKDLSKDMAVESIVRSGRDILDLDKNVVAAAMCNTNYINVYLKADGARCMVTFEGTASGRIANPDQEFRVECKPSGGASKLVKVPYKVSQAQAPAANSQEAAH